MSPGDSEGRQVGEEVLLIAAYLLSSGRGLLDEPRQYGAFRCLDAARRLLALAPGLGAGHPGLDDVRRLMDDVMCGPMTDRDLDTLMDHLCVRLATALEDTDVITS